MTATVAVVLVPEATLVSLGLVVATPKLNAGDAAVVDEVATELLAAVDAAEFPKLKLGVIDGPDGF